MTLKEFLDNPPEPKLISEKSGEFEACHASDFDKIYKLTYKCKCLQIATLQGEYCNPVGAIVNHLECFLGNQLVMSFYLQLPLASIIKAAKDWFAYGVDVSGLTVNKQ